MATITIASATLNNWQHSSDVALRIYALQSFVAADGSMIAAGVPSEDSSENSTFFQSVACTLAGSTLSIAACTLLSTTDSLDLASAQYSAWFFTTEGQRICPFAEFAAFALPSSPTSTTWKDIAIAQRGSL
jgi:hypothetical protein